MPIMMNSNTLTNHPADQVLHLTGVKMDVDDYALKALDATVEFIKAKAPNAKDRIVAGSLSELVSKVSARLNSSGLDDISMLLLSNTSIYATLVYEAIQNEKVKDDDDLGLYNSVLRSVADLPKRYFLAKLLTEVINAKRVRLKAENKQWQRLDDLTLEQGISIRAGQVEPAVMAILSTLYKEGDTPYYVDRYISRGVIAKTAFTPAVRRAMVDYLVQLGVQIKSEEDFNKGTYDDYFVLAYNEARKLSAAADDPLDVARTKGSEISWDFTVDGFESTESQGVIPSNIKAAGALDYIYYIGDRMHVFNVANALVLRWASGMLDVPDGKVATDLYRFHKRRTERSTTEERAMMYKRVLNKGEGKLLSNMMPNKEFPALWHQLMIEVAEFIKKAEGSRADSVQVSRSPLYQATKNLQYNLTEHMTGMAHRQVHEDYAHLQDAIGILKNQEIIDHFGGRRKSLWNVVERVAKEDLGMTLPTAALRGLAVEGNKVFQWTANFVEGAVKESDFKTFLNASESWILAQATVEGEKNLLDDDDDDDDNKHRSNGNGKKDKDDDWDF
jgi:hypothetical protein